LISAIDDGGAIGGGDLRRVGIGYVGQKDATPVGGAGASTHILHVEDVILEIFIEDAGLDFVGSLGIGERIFQIAHGGSRLRGQDHGVEHAYDPPGYSYHAHDTDEAPHADAGRAHGSDFAVGGEATEAQQNADEHGHRNRNREHVREGEQDDLENRAQRGAVADDHFQQVGQIADEEDEGENRAPDAGVRQDFRQDVSGEDPHS
jgi:hypothetical protein